MPVYYDGAHSIVLFKVNEDTGKVTQAMRSWTDLHMVPSTRPYVVLPEPNIKMISLPLSNNIIDATDFLAYDIVAKPREGSWEFYIDHEKYGSSGEAYNTIVDFFDGSVFYVLLEDENEYIYYGRLYASDYQPDANFSKIIVQYNLDPDEQENNLLTTKHITRNGTYLASDDGVLGYSMVVASHITGDIEAEEYICGLISFYYSPNVSKIRANAFRGNEQINRVECQNCIEISDYAFYSCVNLTNISFPSCSIIGDSTFYGCSSLSRASFPECSIINAYAFKSCVNLIDISFPSCSVIRERAFAYCSNLSIASFPECTTIESGAFTYCKELFSIGLTNCVSIGYDAFARDTKLGSIYLPSCVNVDHGAFDNCTRLESVYLPLCEVLGYEAFHACLSLQRIDNLQSCSIINESAFGNCISLNYVELPNASVIHSNAFVGCYRLNTLSLPGSTICSLQNSNAFDTTPIGGFNYYNNSNYGSIYVPSDLYSSYKSAPNWSFYKDRITSINT